MRQQQTEVPRDPERIDATSNDEIRGWAKELGVSNVAILDAVEKVGSSVREVWRHLDQAMAGGHADA